MKRVFPAIVALLGLVGFLSAQQPDFESIAIENGLSQGMIFGILQTRNGFLWVRVRASLITSRMPTFLRKRRLPSFQHINTKSGLPNNVIYGILPGSKDEFWCSTNRGLAKLSPQGSDKRAFEITTFTAATGLQDNEFNTQAFFQGLQWRTLVWRCERLESVLP